MSFFKELKRRNVFRVGIAYALMGWVLLQGADFALDLIDAPNWVIQALSVVVVIGLPIALFFAWAFELTPEGIKREHEVDRSQSIAHRTGRKLDRMIIGVLAIAVGYLLVDKLVLQDNTAPEASAPDTAEVEAPDTVPASVAVLPFVNMSGDQENEYFSDGLTETLLHMLAQLPELKVAARTSSFSFKGKDTSIDEVATTLGVAHVLEGSVQKSGERVRVTAQLIRADDGFHVWSQNYTRPLEDIFAIQDEIATDVANALDASLLGSGKVKLAGLETENLTAYDTYLKAMEQQAIFSYGSLAKAEGLFKEALAADPDFTDARLGLARNYLMMYGTGLIDHGQAQDQMSPVLEQVRRANPEDRLARALEMTLRLQSPEVRPEEETTAILYELRDLLPLIPTEAYIRSNVSVGFTFFIKQPEQGLEVIEAGLLIDPLSPYLHSRKGDTLKEMERFEEARTSYERSLELDNRDPGVYFRMSDLAWHTNDIPDMLRWQRQSIEVDPQDHELVAVLVRDFYALGMLEEGDRWARRVEALAPGSDVARMVALQRAEAHGRQAEAVEIAAGMIRDQVSMRQGSYPEALFGFLRYKSRLRAYESGHDFLLEVRPELEDPGHMPEDFQGLITQWARIGFMLGFKSPEETREAWRAYRAVIDSTGTPFFEPDEFGVVFEQVLLGEPERAREIALEGHLARPLSKNLGELDRYALPQLAEVRNDPVVASRLSNYDRELAQVRSVVEDMLRGPEWAE